MLHFRRRLLVLFALPTLGALSQTPPAPLPEGGKGPKGALESPPADPAGQQGPGPGVTTTSPQESFDAFVAAALRSNPEVLQAEAKLRLAQANLNQTRLRILSELLAAQREQEKLRAAVTYYEKVLSTINTRIQVGQAERDAGLATERSLLEAKAGASQADVRLQYLAGRSGPGTPQGEAGFLDAFAPGVRLARRPPIPPEMEERLSKEVKLDSSFSLDIARFVEQLTPYFPGIDIVVDSDARITKKQAIFERQMPLRQQLLRAADLLGVCFVFREYGILVTTPQRAASMLSATIPEDAAREQALPRR